MATAIECCWCGEPFDPDSPEATYDRERGLEFCSQDCDAKSLRENLLDIIETEGEVGW